MKKINLPTKISIARLVSVPFVLLLILPDNFNLNLMGLILFAISSLTDKLDGYLARKLNQVTELGGFIDTLADKLLFNLPLLIYAFKGYISYIIIIIIFLREIIIQYLRHKALKKKIAISAKIGKVKGPVQVSLIILCMLIQLKILGSGFLYLAGIVSYILLAIILLGTLEFFLRNRNRFAGRMK